MLGRVSDADVSIGQLELVEAVVVKVRWAAVLQLRFGQLHLLSGSLRTESVWLKQDAAARLHAMASRARRGNAHHTVGAVLAVLSGALRTDGTNSRRSGAPVPDVMGASACPGTRRYCHPALGRAQDLGDAQTQGTVSPHLLPLPLCSLTPGSPSRHPPLVLAPSRGSPSAAVWSIHPFVGYWGFISQLSSLALRIPRTSPANSLAGRACPAASVEGVAAGGWGAWPSRSPGKSCTHFFQQFGWGQVSSKISCNLGPF